MVNRFPSIATESRRRLARSFAAYAIRAQHQAKIARAIGDPCAWAIHMRCASQLAHKADMLGA